MIEATETNEIFLVIIVSVSFYLFGLFLFSLAGTLHLKYWMVEMLLRKARSALFQFIQAFKQRLSMFQGLNGPVHDPLPFFGIGEFFWGWTN